MIFENFIKHNNFNDEKNKFLIIIGSGFNNAFIKEEKIENFNSTRIFKDWKCLLELTKLDFNLNFSNSGNFLIDFENIILKYRNLEPLLAAYEIEQIITKHISGKYKESIKLLKNEDLNLDLLNIFNEKYVSEIINLNFDTLFDEWLAKFQNVKFNKTVKSNYRSKKTSVFNDKRFMYRDVGEIKIWHPHGDIYYPNSLVLSTRKYGMQISKIEKLRCRYKAQKDENRMNYDFTWFDSIIHRPILIIGASLSAHEQDILFALSTRKRNFLKNSSKGSQIFIMSEKINNLGEWATLIYERMEYKEQWERLSNQFKN